MVSEKASELLNRNISLVPVESADIICSRQNMFLTKVKSWKTIKLSTYKDRKYEAVCTLCYNFSMFIQLMNKPKGRYIVSKSIIRMEKNKVCYQFIELATVEDLERLCY